MRPINSNQNQLKPNYKRFKKKIYYRELSSVGRTLYYIYKGPEFKFQSSNFKKYNSFLLEHVCDTSFIRVREEIKFYFLIKKYQTHLRYFSNTCTRRNKFYLKIKIKPVCDTSLIPV
jgi:hypothetical protein